MSSSPLTQSRVDRFRRFTRTLVRRLGIVEAVLPGANLPLLEAHILFELRDHTTLAPAEIARRLGVDAERVRNFAVDLGVRRLVTWPDMVPGVAIDVPLAAPALDTPLTITRQGRARMSALEHLVRMTVRSILAQLSTTEHRQLVDAMVAIERLLLRVDETSGSLVPDEAPILPYMVVAPSGRPRATPPGGKRLGGTVHIRHHRAGDLGHVVSRHGAIYAEEFGWDETFEAYVAKAAAEFIENFRATRSRAFIAEADGAIVGSAFVADKSADVARLRMVYVEREWRGHGVGVRLVEEAMAFARTADYQRMSLWTNHVLVDARKLYDKLGFKLVASEPYEGFGQKLIGEIWERDL